MPTSAQIAERAGYSVRSVFERFPDLLSLRIAATDHAFALGKAQAVVRDVDGDRPTRIRSQVETRAQTCEKWLPLWRALNANQGESAELKLRIRLVREADHEAARADVSRPNWPRSMTRARKHTLIALEALTDFESWARMRELYGLSVEQGCALWIRMIDRILPPTPAR